MALEYTKVSAQGDIGPIQRTDKLYVIRGVGTSGHAEVGDLLSRFIDDEVPTGSVNGSNVNFTLSQTPSPAASLNLFLNGIRLRRGVDYTLTGNAVAYAVAPESGDNHYAFYRY